MKLFGNSGKRKKKKEQEPAYDAAEESAQEDVKTGSTAGKVFKRIGLTVLVLALICVAVYAGVNLTLAPPDTKPDTAAAVSPSPSASASAVASGEESPDVDESGRISGRYTFLIAGEDDDYGGTDVIMVGMLDVNEHTLNIVSIPRDTMVNVPWETKKANSYKNMYEYLDEDYDQYVDALIAGVKNLIGFEVDAYVTIDLDGFVSMIDAIGGVEFEVPQRMYYTDPAQNLYIDLQAGLQTLSGEQAMGLIRYRKNYEHGDIDRISVQQDFLKVAAQQLMDQNLLTMTQLVSIFSESAVADMSLNNLLWYAKEMFKLDIDDINFVTLAGNYAASYGGLSYVTIYTDEWLAQINEYINPYAREMTLDDLDLVTEDATGQLYYTKAKYGTAATETASASASATS